MQESGIARSTIRQLLAIRFCCTGSRMPGGRLDFRRPFTPAERRELPQGIDREHDFPDSADFL
jgi:hypothetical protein